MLQRDSILFKWLLLNSTSRFCVKDFPFLFDNFIQVGLFPLIKTSLSVGNKWNFTGTVSSRPSNVGSPKTLQITPSYLLWNTIWHWWMSIAVGKSSLNGGNVHSLIPVFPFWEKKHFSCSSILRFLPAGKSPFPGNEVPEFHIFSRPVDTIIRYT